MVRIRLQKVSDAERFFEILKNHNIIYFSINPPTIDDEIVWLEQNAQKRKHNTEWNYTILYNNEIVGAIGVKIDYHRKYIGEIGYFLDENYWNKGITTQAVALMEDICVNNLKLSRLEILIMVENTASEKVAINNNYTREGLLHKLLKSKDGKSNDSYLYAKVF